MAKAKTTEKKNDYIIIVGTLKKAYFGKTKFDEEEKYRVTIYNDSMPYDLITAYDDTPAKLQPGWFKDAEGYMNLNSKFSFPVKDIKGKEILLEEYLSGAYGEPHNAKVMVKIRQKDGAIYPVALKVMEDGEPVDAFEGMD